MKVTDDRRKCGGYDRLVQSGKEHAEKQRAHDEQHTPPRQVQRRGEGLFDGGHFLPAVKTGITVCSRLCS